MIPSTNIVVSLRGAESSLHRVKKSLATSFHHLLNREGNSSERDTPPKGEVRGGGEVLSFILAI